MNIQLPPEIEAGLRAEAAVKAYLGEASATQVPVSRKVSSRNRAAEMAWAANPSAEFFGKWVVLQGSEVVASGSNPKELYEDVRAKGSFSPFVIFMSSDEHEPFAGGWID